MESIQISSVETDLDYPTEEGKVGSIKPEHKEKLQNMHKDLLKNMTLSHLLPDLHQKRVITFSEYKDLNNLVGAGRESQAATEFLLSLNTKSFADFYAFCESLIIAGRAPWLTHNLMDDNDWKTLNRLREKRIKEVKGSNDVYFEIPKCVTKEQLQQIEDNMRMGMDDIDDIWEQTNVKQGASWRQGASNEPMDVLSAFEGEVSATQETLDETVPKEVLSESEDESVEAESAEDDDRPDWVKELRKYQLELGKPGIKGLNYLITAPTGSGKTHVAAYVIYEHLRKFGDSARVLFFCPEVGLVEQQFDALKEKFDEWDMDFLVGSKTADKIEIEDMVRTHQIVVVTPAIVDNALAKGKIPGLDAVTLMIFDECHHTDGEHPYNKVMSKYLDVKLKSKGQNRKLPQVIGMTASLGVGKARGEEDAISHVLKMCANMDASQIAVVRKNAEELFAYTNDPKEHTQVVPERSHDEFQEHVNCVMKEIEEKITVTLASGKKGNFFDFPEKKYTQYYRTVLADTKNKLKDRPSEAADRLIVLPCLEHLMAFSWCVDMHRMARPQDAVMMLRMKLETRPRGKMDSENKPEIEQWLEELLKDVVPKLNKCCEDQNMNNPRLDYIKEVIMERFRENPKSRCILFTKTRVSTEALKSWINEDTDMGKLGAERITGRVCEQQFGITNSRQDQILQDFKDGLHKILVATSVAEEGLDIQACNIIIRYNYSTNEVGRVQTRGRARVKDSRITNVDSEEHVDEVQGKEKLSLHREGLMKSAVRKIHEMERREYWNFVKSFQLTEYRNRYFRRMLKEAQEKNKNKKRLILACFSCSRHMCYSDEIVKFEDTTKWYMCKNPEFDKLIKIEKDDKRAKQIDNFQKQYKVYCNNPECRWLIGFVFEYKKEVRFPAIKGNVCHFYKVKADGRRGEKIGKFKKWDDTPYRYENITEKELLAIFKERTYEPED